MALLVCQGVDRRAVYVRKGMMIACGPERFLALLVKLQPGNEPVPHKLTGNRCETGM
jgi:hypothetical protein